MISFIKILTVCSAVVLLFSSCDNLNLEPGVVPVVINYSEYRTVLDSTYFKLWSDSTWEKFSRDTVINGTRYISLINSGSKEFYYNNKNELSGFKEPGDSLILFDEPLSIHEQLSLNEVYTIQTAFKYQNISHTVVLKQTYSDTTTVSALSKSFTGCVIVKSSFQITTSGGDYVENEQVWLAKGHSAIKKIKNYRDTVYVVQAIIGGNKWNK